MRRAGPMGEDSAHVIEWDEKGRTMISHIYVSFDDEFIKSIQFGYLENGALVMSEKYGPSAAPNLRAVRLNEDEYVTKLSGVQEDCGGGIHSLTFHTNRGEHGPIGRKSRSGVKIEIDPAIHDRREFGGFFGTYCKYGGDLSTIGIYVNPIAMS